MLRSKIAPLTGKTLMRTLIGSAVVVLGGAAVASQSKLVIGWEAAPRTIDPRWATDANSQYLENLLHCSLIDFDEDGKTIGNLAAAWEWTTPTELQVALKPSAKFSDGTAVTAADVVATYQFFKDESVKAKSPRKGAFEVLTSVKAVGDKVSFALKEADSTFIGNLVVGILPSKLAVGDQLTDAKSMVGCGPFSLANMDVTGLELRKNPHYGLGALAKTETLQIKVVKDETTRFAKLRAGELDIVQNEINREKLADVGKKYPNLKVVKRPGLNVTYLGFNMRDKLVSQVAVRQAIDKGINREAIIKHILEGYAVPARSMLPPTDEFFNKALPEAKYDPDGAMAILDKAGFTDPDGKGPKARFQLSYKTTTNATRLAIARAIAADLKRIGIEVTVHPLEWGRFKDDVEKGKVQMWSLSWVGFKDPDIFRYAFATENFAPVGGNRGFYSNEKLDKLVNEAKAETDREKRQNLYDQTQEILSLELPYVNLWHEEIFAVVNNKVEGFRVFADGRLASLREAEIP